VPREALRQSPTASTGIAMRIMGQEAWPNDGALLSLGHLPPALLPRRTGARTGGKDARLACGTVSPQRPASPLR
jgi:hypothetical protein